MLHKYKMKSKIKKTRKKCPESLHAIGSIHIESAGIVFEIL
jgi:hypothetical protein